MYSTTHMGNQASMHRNESASIERASSTIGITIREQTFDPRPKWALVPAFFAPGIRNTFSPGWSHQPGLKAPPLYPGRLLLPPRA